MCDKLVFDLSQEVEGTPNVFVRKDWINILDNMNSNYQSNQSIIDTSQLSNSNKWMSYREGYLAVPMLLTVSTPATNAAAGFTFSDHTVGLKNWFGNIIHSLTLDYNGTTIIQQTPFSSMWNHFKLMTSLSYNDIITQGATIGFYPDTPDSFLVTTNNAPQFTTGYNVCNNDVGVLKSNSASCVNNNYNQWIQINGTTGSGGNEGLANRIKWITWNYSIGTGGFGVTYNALLDRNNIQQIWKSNIVRSCATNANDISPVPITTAGIMQISVMGIIYLKHLHSFFNMIPLLKGVFMKLTLNLNNTTTTATFTPTGYESYQTNVPVGGVNPLMVTSFRTGSNPFVTAGFNAGSIIKYNLSVGNVCTDNTMNIAPNFTGNIARSVYLYVPAYTFNEDFEGAYLKSSPKEIRYTDIYQNQMLNIGTGQNFNHLVTNGIANLKSI